MRVWRVRRRAVPWRCAQVMVQLPLFQHAAAGHSTRQQPMSGGHEAWVSCSAIKLQHIVCGAALLCTCIVQASELAAAVNWDDIKGYMQAHEEVE